MLSQLINTRSLIIISCIFFKYTFWIEMRVISKPLFHIWSFILQETRNNTQYFQSFVEHTHKPTSQKMVARHFWEKERHLFGHEINLLCRNLSHLHYGNIETIPIRFIALNPNEKKTNTDWQIFARFFSANRKEIIIFNKKKKDVYTHFHI